MSRSILPRTFGLLLVCGCAVAGEERVTDGESPAVSPDGRSIAFQRYEDGVMKVGVCAAAGGDARWIEAGPGMAAYPAWAPDGSLVYTCGHETTTAHEAFKAKATEGGYGLRVMNPDGTKRELCTGYTRDFLPSVSPDGKTVWFATTRGVKSPSKSYSMAMASNVAKVPFDGSAKPEVVIRAPGAFNAAVAQPVLSPDGRKAAWAQMSSFEEGWSLYGAKTADLGRADRHAQLTPDLLTALSPRWHPDGGLLAFTGFRPDDPGWGVWVMDVKTFALKRVADGENPAFSPDGRWLYYDRGRTIYRRPFGAGDRPVVGETVFEDFATENGPKRTLWKTDAEKGPQTLAPLGKDFAVGADRTVYLRARVKWNGVKSLQVFVRGVYGESEQGLLLFVTTTGDAWFSTRDRDNVFVGVSRALPGAGEYDLVGVRTKLGYYLFVNGAMARSFRSGSHPLDKPIRFEVGKGCPKDTTVHEAEVGLGWPADLIHPAITKEEVMR